MNIQSSKKKMGLIILICMIGILLIYMIDVPKLSNRLTSWQTFGKPPIQVVEIQYFIPDTPNVIGYKDLASGEMVFCATTVAYVKTEANEPYRCCDTGNGISCLAADFSSDIPVPDPECAARLKEIYAIPDSWENAKYYQMIASCRRSDDRDVNEITLVKIGNDDQISWKYLSTDAVTKIGIALKCILAPLLLIIAIIMVMSLRRK